jgi:hypothetical protein
MNRTSPPFRAEQCGFSTSATEHAAVSEHLQMAKLARIVEVARSVWGGEPIASNR